MSKTEKKGVGFVKQAAILAAASLMVRVLGFLYRLPLTDMIGDEGNGIYSAGFYLYNMFLIMSSAGLPVAISRMVAEKRSGVAISALTLAEAVFGAKKKRSQRLESLIEMFREMFPVVPWTEDAASAYADIRTCLEESGTPIGDMDMLIAASAIAGGFVLVTNNVRHFRRIDGLVVENWVSASVR